MRVCKINFIEREKIAKRYKEGESTVALAKDYGVSNSTISAILREKNVEIRPHVGRPKAFTSELIEAIRKEYEAGCTTVALAKKYNTSKATIAGYIRSAGGTLRPRGTRGTRTA